jgi:hypothetical protein
LDLSAKLPSLAFSRSLFRQTGIDGLAGSRNNGTGSVHMALEVDFCSAVNMIFKELDIFPAASMLSRSLWRTLPATLAFSMVSF